MAPLYFEETVLLATLAKTFGESAARAAVEKLDLEGKTYPLKVSVPLHEKLQTVVSNPEHVSFVQEVVNDALATSFASPGLPLGRSGFPLRRRCNESGTAVGSATPGTHGGP